MRTKLAWLAAAALIAALGGGLTGALTSTGDRPETRPTQAASPETPSPFPSPTETETGFDDEGAEDDDGSSGPGSGEEEDDGGSGPG